MKSTTGEYFRGLDHVRALAVLLVFIWHFLYGREGASSLPGAVAQSAPMVLFDQGQIGVALFMTLSGYLFAKLLDGKDIAYRYFFWNRLLRLLPLLLLVMLINAALAAARSADLRSAYWYLLEMPRGLVFPTWPNGGWSITVELHFYLILPVLLLLSKRWEGALWLVIGGALMLRAGLYLHWGTVQDAAYWTLVGRIDQFAFGIIAFRARAGFVGRHALAAGIGLVFLGGYFALAAGVGFRFDPKIISGSPLWIVASTLEGLSFAALIAWYDGSFSHRRGRLSNLVATVGEYSYSIYLLHFFFVFAVAHWVHTQLLDLTEIRVALPVALLAFAAMLPIGYLSMRFVERPFLKLRQPYRLARSPREGSG